MNRMFAIIEREMRKFFRSPTLMVMSHDLPLVQLIIIGNAFGGKIAMPAWPWWTTTMASRR
jgi:ABC-2 type transport system permease protein